MEIVFSSKNLGELIIKEVKKDIAKKIIVENHYSKKWNNNFGVINIGIFKKEYPNHCLGVACFGNPMNPKAYTKISDCIEQNQLLELNRMWIDDALGKNAESILISKSFNIIKKTLPHIKIIQSFADGRLGCGTIYKATNFKYYGCSKTVFLMDKITQETHHKMMFEKTSRPVAMGTLCHQYVCGAFDIIEVNTYRYLYCLDYKFYKNIKLKEEKYPEYQKGLTYIEKDFSLNNMTKAYLILQCMKEYDKSYDIILFLAKKYTKEEINKSITESINNIHIKNFISKTKHEKEFFTSEYDNCFKIIN